MNRLPPHNRLDDGVLRRGWYVPIKAIVMAMVAIRLTSRGPVLYSQVRLGLHGEPFKVYKLRTMYDRCEEKTGPCWSDPNHDDRVTFVGWYLRQFKIDELPQLWNVIRGEMGLVGPRPERPVFVTQFEVTIPHYRERLSIRPGLTGLAQVQLPPDTDMESVRRKLTCDLYYIQHLSPGMDLRILLSTVNYLAGVPFWVSKAFLRIPSQDVAERAYRRLVETSNPQAYPV